MYIQTKYRIAEESQIWCSSFALPIIQPFRVQQNPIKIWDLQNPAIKKKEPRGPKTISSNCAVVFVNPSIWILGQVVASAAPSNGKADAQPGQARQAKSRIKGGSALHKPMFSKSTFLQLNLFFGKNGKLMKLSISPKRKDTNQTTNQCNTASRHANFGAIGEGF